MKNITLLAILAFAVFSINATAQSTATATATATIVKPISIGKNVDMNFGNIASNGSVGTVVMGTDGARIAGAGVTLPATTGTTTAAKFTVTGEGAYTYDLTLPSTITISNTDATPASMVVNGFTSNSTKKLSGGTEVFFVGATLNLGASQAAGIYTNSTGFDVIVNYN
jgi:hypothetical protein